MTARKAIIIGAGPAGLTAASELLSRSSSEPLIIEKCKRIGGISATVDFSGNRLDIGGHRFFTKADQISSHRSVMFAVSNHRYFPCSRPFLTKECYEVTFGAPNGIRTRVAALKGRYPWPLDDGGINTAGRTDRRPDVS